MNYALLLFNLSEYAHSAWSGWMRYMFSKSKQNEDGTVTIPADLVSRWRRQMNTPYNVLPDKEQESDKAEANKIFDIMKRNAIDNSGLFAFDSFQSHIKWLEDKMTDVVRANYGLTKDKEFLQARIADLERALLSAQQQQTIVVQRVEPPTVKERLL